jgi:predicted secreted hydrolase
MQHLRSHQKLTLLCVVTLVISLLCACSTPSPQTYVSASVVESMSSGAGEGFARAYEPVEFVFPRDHGAHPDYRTEWWYFTGNVQDQAGRQFGYQLTFFRSALTPALPERASDLATNQVYMAHFALTDQAANQHESFERYSRGAGELAGAVGEPAFAIWLEDWSVRTVEPGVMELRAQAETADGPFALAFTLRPSGPPILQGNRGLSQKGPDPGNASYYYSLVRIATSGVITTPQRTTVVSGLSWLDHEYSTAALGRDAVGWDWFSVQLADGTALMFAQVRVREGLAMGDFAGILVAPDGQQQSIKSADFTLRVLDQWTSPTTGFTYPSGWQVDFSSREMSLTLTPLIPDQEMLMSFVYWEGAVTVTGERAGQAVEGVGYVELTGYGKAAAEFQR